MQQPFAVAEANNWQGDGKPLQADPAPTPFQSMMTTLEPFAWPVALVLVVALLVLGLRRRWPAGRRA